MASRLVAAEAAGLPAAALPSRSPGRLLVVVVVVLLLLLALGSLSLRPALLRLLAALSGLLPLSLLLLLPG